MIEGREKFTEAIRNNRSSVFFIVDLSDGKNYYSSDHKDWLKIKEICESKSLSITSLSLQFRSHKEDCDIDGAEGVYLIRSAMGRIGQTSTRDYYTSGKLVKGVVHKTMWITPELVEEKTYEDTLENCFEEALIYNNGKRKIRQE